MVYTVYIFEERLTLFLTQGDSNDYKSWQYY